MIFYVILNWNWKSFWYAHLKYVGSTYSSVTIRWMVGIFKNHIWVSYFYIGCCRSDWTWLATFCFTMHSLEVLLVFFALSSWFKSRVFFLLQWINNNKETMRKLNLSFSLCCKLIPLKWRVPHFYLYMLSISIVSTKWFCEQTYGIINTSQHLVRQIRFFIKCKISRICPLFVL